MEIVTAHAPGRVELLGNHTDYNEGYVLAAAIDCGVTIRGFHQNGRITLQSKKLDGSLDLGLDQIRKQSGDLAWANYPLGVVNCLLEAGFAIEGFDATVDSDLPIGAGLSSSAALEVATAMLLKKIFGFEMEPIEMAKLCRRAENEFVGVNSGLLDQATSIFGKKGNAVFLDCRHETVAQVPFSDDLALLITHSGISHSLSGSEYNERRAQCFEAAATLGAKALRHLSRHDLEAGRTKLPEVVYRRALHIVGENDRVLRGVGFLRAGHAEKFGQLMFESHESSRVNFENSTPALDALVEIAREQPEVLGSRLTGGGFGGATVSLVPREVVKMVGEEIVKKYQARTGHAGQSYVCEISDGAA